MPNQFHSVVHHFQANNSNNKLFLYHEGHQTKNHAEKNIQILINKGYDVMFLSMPLYDQNSKNYDLHNNFTIMQNKTFNPISLFITPVIVSINHAKKNYDYNSISMTGLSGGGWTTTIAAAVDNRITKSYPVAGSMPLQFKKTPRGEYEETPNFFKQNITYETMYYLGSYGKNRKQTQILNMYDPCCFNAYSYGKFRQATNTPIYEDYERQIQKALGKQGSFEVILDDTHTEHKLSRNAMKYIIRKDNEKTNP